MTPARRSSPRPVGEGAVLIVDDDPPTLRLASRVLARLGHEVLVADSGEEALRIFASNPQPVDLLVTDVLMPGMSGRQLAEALRRLRPDLPILYMSGEALTTLYPDEPLPSGMFFLAKPFPPETLSAAAQEALSWRMN